MAADWFNVPGAGGGASSSSSSSAPFPDLRLNVDGGPNGDGILSSWKAKMMKEAAVVVAEGAFTQARTKASGLSRLLSVNLLTDMLQPYFEIDGKMLFARLLGGMLPQAQEFSLRAPDLYGPLVVNLTLATFLIMFIKMASSLVVEGTVIGTALGLCFGYWLGGSALLLFLTYFTNTRAGMINILASTGYSMTAYLLIVLLAYVTASAKVFYLLLLLLGVPSALSIGSTLRSVTEDPAKGWIVLGTSCGFHLLFLIYLRVSYLKLS